MKRFTLLATLILLGAAFLLLADLHHSPPGLHFDESADVVLSQDIALRHANYFPVVRAYTGREALYFYLAVPLIWIVGPDPMAVRLTSALFGLITVAVTIALGKVMFRKGNRPDYNIALLVGAWIAVSWPIVWSSRQAFRSAIIPGVWACGLWFLWITLRRGRRWVIPAILGGFFTGLTLYIYIATRIIPLWIPVPLLLLLIIDRRRKLRLSQIAVYFAAMFVTVLPIGLFYLNDWSTFIERMRQVAVPNAKAVTLTESIIAHLEMFFIKGDPILRYNAYSGRPYFDPISGVLMVLGVIMAVILFVRQKSATDKMAAAFVLLSPLLTISSILAVSGNPPSWIRALPMNPLIFFFPALGAVLVAKVVRRFRLLPRPALLAGIFLFAVGVQTWSEYRVWATNPEVFYQSDGDLDYAARWLEQNTKPDTALYIWSTFYDHPTVMLRKLEPGQINWLQADRMMVPPPDRDSIFILPRSVDAGGWVKLLESGRVTDIPLGPDGQPAFQAFRFAAGKFPLPTPTTTMADNVASSGSIGNILKLRGVDLPTIAAGQTVAPTLYWEVLAKPDRDDLTAVVILVDAWDNEITRIYPYFEESSHWWKGSWVLEQPKLNIPYGTPPGDYTIKVQWVSKVRQNEYLPVLDDQGRFSGIVHTLAPLKITAATGGPGSAVSSDVPSVIKNLFLTQKPELPTTLAQGERLAFTIRWLVLEKFAEKIPFRLMVETTGDRNPVTIWEGQPVHDTYPITEWSPNEPVSDRYNVQIPADLPPGDYRLVYRVGTDAASGEAFSAPLKITAVDRTFTAPPLAHKADLRFGDSMALIGYEVTPADGNNVTVKITWQALKTPDRDYTVFVHLMKPDGTLFSQVDRPPARLTGQWVAGEVMTETYTMAAPDGDYTFSAGLYLPDNGLRLPLTDKSSGSAVSAGDAATLTK
jgi:4-amino-4-deoxy-L-arabinose transferase-like glycosyltransferase